MSERAVVAWDEPIAKSAARRGWWERYRRQPLATFGLGLGLTIALLALFAVQVAPFDPKASVAAPMLPPSAAHWFGSDDLGRDTFSTVVHGARAALLVGLLAAATSLLVGTMVGLASGYFGGYVDDFLMRLTESFQLLPRFFLALLAITFFGGSLWLVALLLGLTFWPSTARILRAQVLSLRGREFVLAARALGASDRWVMLRHVLPNSLSPLIVTAAGQVATAILTEAGLSFLGLGDPTVVSWGQMLNDAQRFYRTAWWLFAFPGAALVLTVLATTMIADGLTESLSPGREDHGR